MGRRQFRGQLPIQIGMKLAILGPTLIAGLYFAAAGRFADASAHEQPYNPHAPHFANAVFDATALRVWVSYAGQGREAYQRSYVSLDLGTLDADHDGQPDLGAADGRAR